MNVIVPGASGFLGRNFLLKAPKTWNITALFNDNLNFSEFVVAHGLHHVSPQRCDLTRTASVKDLSSRLEKKFELCLYLAANGDPSVSVQEPVADLNMTTVTLVKFLQHCNIKKLIYVSSGAVYDGLQGLVSPETPVDPRLPYAISHLASENYVKFFAARGIVQSYMILRFFGAFGPYEPARKIYSRLINAFCLGDDHVFSLRGNGRNYIDAMYVDDAIQGILSVIRGDQENMTVDFCKGERLTLSELVQRAAFFFNKKQMPVEYHGETDEYNEFYASPAAMYELFGFEPHIDLEDGLRRFARFLEHSVKARQ